MPTKRQLAIQEMKQKGMSNAQVARYFGVTNGATVRDFGIAVDAEKWEQERQDAIKFFNGLTHNKNTTCTASAGMSLNNNLRMRRYE